MSRRPEKIARAAILDIVPQHHLYNNMNKAWGTFSWHWLFMIQPYDFPERLMSAEPDFFIEKKLAKTKQGLSFFDPSAIAEYKRYFRNPATVHAMCEDYRASAGIDFETDTKDFEAGEDNSAALAWARPAASAATQSRGRAKSGSVMRPTFAAPRRCPADIISPKKRRRRPTRSCASSSAPEC